MDFDKLLFEKRYKVSMQQILAVVAVVLLIGSVYGFGYGFFAGDYVVYLAEHNDDIVYGGLDGNIYQIQQLENCTKTGSSGVLNIGCTSGSYVVPPGGYVKPSRREHKMDRLRQVFS